MKYQVYFWTLCLSFLTTHVLFSPVALGALRAMDPLVQDTTQDKEPVDVVFFKREGSKLIPTCRVPVDSYPEILSKNLPYPLLQEVSEINQTAHNGDYSSTTEGGEASDFQSMASPLEECSPDLSAELSGMAEHFELYPQLAAAPAMVFGAAMIIGANVGSCGIAGMFTGAGVYEHIVEDQQDTKEAFIARYPEQEWREHIPTNGQIMTGSGVFIGSTVGPVHTYAFLPIGWEHLKKNKVALRALTLSSAVAGVLCSVAGGVIGYFSAHLRKTTDKLKQTIDKLIESQKKAVQLFSNLQLSQNEAKQLFLDLQQESQLSAERRETLTLANQEIDRLIKEVENQRKIQEDLKTKLMEIQNRLRESQNKIQQLSHDLQQAQNKAEQLSHDLQKESQQSVERQTALLLANQEINRLTKDIEEQLKIQEELENQLRETQNELKESQNKVQQLSQNWQQAQNEIRQLSQAEQQAYRQSIVEAQKEGPR